MKPKRFFALWDHWSHFAEDLVGALCLFLAIYAGLFVVEIFQ